MNTTLLAARHVTRHATSTAEAREFLDMLGLTDNVGRLVDEVETTRSKTMPLEHAGPRVRPSHTEFEERRPAVSTAPEALRNLPPVIAVVAKPKPAPRPKPAKVPGASKATGIGNLLASNERRKAPCGTHTALRRHRRNNEHCNTCENAPRPQRTTAQAIPVREHCGTLKGYQAHKDRHEKACDACKAPYNAARRAKAAQKLTPVHRDVCGSTRGYDAHRRHGEDSCVPCRLAENARCRDRRVVAA